MTTVFDGLPGAFTAALGETVTITPSSGAREIKAIFSARSQDEIGIAQPVPAIHAKTSDVSDLAYGDAVAARGKSYVARTFRADGRGMTAITLEAA